MKVRGRFALVRFTFLFCGLALTGCAPASENSDTLQPSEHIQFSIRGRLDRAELAYRIETSGAPVSADQLREACAMASSVWNRTGVASIERALAVEVEGRPTVTISFQRDVHGACTPFGRDPSIAHTGPCGLENSMHLDGERDWLTDGTLLTRTIAHEFGHALGLGHSLDPAALMNPEDDPRRTEPKRSDLAGLHSLYGGGLDSEDDLALIAGDCFLGKERHVVLRGVAPAGVSKAAVFDTRGDGSPELLVWRTDGDGQGSLIIYSFDGELRLTKTLGPLHGICPPGASIHFGETAGGERLLVRVLENNRAQALAFDELGEPATRREVAFELPGLADLDGDWVLDEPLTSDFDPPCGLNWIATGDFNRDGQEETWQRLQLEQAH